MYDYKNRLNGYVRSGRLHFKKNGRDANEHVQQFLATCDDDQLAESLYHARVTDIHELEEIIKDVFKGKEGMAKRDSEYRHSKSRDGERRLRELRAIKADECIANIFHLRFAFFES
ncbi:hypothetical protein PInf_008441 [Phytophthora infestans]|nr:hypothetical protein PInf_008441 [Phytophthora infestans]